MEHQDLNLDNKIATLGATGEELPRLYRGHHAAMLTSLSLHRLGIRIRPELTVFKVICRLEGVTEPQWLSDPSIVAVTEQESFVLGEKGALLVEALV